MSLRIEKIKLKNGNCNRKPVNIFSQTLNIVSASHDDIGIEHTDPNSLSPLRLKRSVTA